MIYEVSPLHREVPTENCCCRGNGAAPALGRVLGWISSSDCSYKVKWTLRSDYLQPPLPCLTFLPFLENTDLSTFRCHKEKLRPWGSQPGALVTSSWIPVVGFTRKGSPKAPCPSQPFHERFPIKPGLLRWIVQLDFWAERLQWKKAQCEAK